jgi:hypothetical protein
MESIESDFTLEEKAIDVFNSLGIDSMSCP